MKHFLHYSIGIVAYLFIFTTSANAQIDFQEVPSNPFEGVLASSIAFADIDGDSDQDLLITGRNDGFIDIAKLFTNDGSGVYTEVVGTPFEGVFVGSIAFADIDGDSDQDVLITGYTSSNEPIAKLYTNNGSGDFSEVMGTPFEGVGHSSIAFTDVDGDSDQDVLITGFNNSNQSTSKLYTNDGSGDYTEVMGTPFEGVAYSSIAFADIDGDSDQDVLITGQNNSFQPSAKLYTNDGSGGYTEATGTPFVGVSFSSIAFADIDGDSDQDVLISGQNNNGQAISKLYTNDGSGGYTEMSEIPFDGVADSSIAFADIDGDNDQDVLITGGGSDLLISKLYSNDGSGSYTEITGTPFEGVLSSSIAFADIDGDNDQDVFITGNNSSNQAISNSYINDGIGGYVEEIGASFEGVAYSSIAFADIDGDSDQDVLVTGQTNISQPIAKFYKNGGIGDYTETEVIATPFEGVLGSSIAFADIDSDNDQDVLITGFNSNGEFGANLFTNTGSGIYLEANGTPFEGVAYSSIAFSDIDGDSDQDVLITGQNNSGQAISKLYTNDGSGGYTEATGTPFEEIAASSIAFADIDGDSDQDVLITGANNSNQAISKLYTNDGGGSYAEVMGTPFEGVAYSSIAFSDIDGDSDQDVLITGVNNSNQAISKLYTNDGGGSYTEVMETPFEQIAASSIAFADVDGDSDQDILITGVNNSNQPISRLYSNNGSGVYVEVIDTPFEGVAYSSIAFADIDGDSDQDVLITGLNNSLQYISKLYINTTPPPCNEPEVPSLSMSTATVCNGDLATLNITGTLNDATAWHIYTESCGGTLIGTTTTGSFELPDPITAEMILYVRGEGGCVSPDVCGSIFITPTDLDDASFSYSGAAFCVSDADPTPTVTGVAGGSFSSTVGLSLDTSTGAIDVSASTPGTYTVTYSTNGTCLNSSDVDITINELDDASFSYSASTYLSTDADPTPTVTGTADGSFSSAAGLTIDSSTGAIDVSASTPGTYTVAYTTAGICPNSTEVNVTIVDCDLQASIQTSNLSCSGENDGALDLSITGGTLPYTFLWSTGAITEDIDNLAPGDYSVTITDVNGCETTASATIVIEDTQDPVLDCLSDQTVTLTSDQTDYILPDYVTNADITATDNCTISSITQTPAAGTVLAPDVYTISFTATDDSGNTTDCSFMLTVEETLGTASVDFGGISLYPNPADQLVIINNAQQHEFKEILLYDIRGRRVMQVKLNSNASSMTLDVTPLESATYIVVLKSETSQVIRRLIKK